MGLDVLLFRPGKPSDDRPCRSPMPRTPSHRAAADAERGGDPELVRESQRRRYADVGLVDKVLELDQQWREGESGGRLMRGLLGSTAVPAVGAGALLPPAVARPLAARPPLTAAIACACCSPRQAGHAEDGVQQGGGGDQQAAQGEWGGDGWLAPGCWRASSQWRGAQQAAHCEA